MNFSQWYEGNKEPLTTMSLEGKLKEAFEAGFSYGLDYAYEDMSEYD